MAEFFIRRPIVAMVISILMVIVGSFTLTGLPISEYPEVSPPVINVSANYRGAASEAVEASVARPIEAQVNGVENMLYMKSVNAADGSMNLTATFDLGTNANINQVNVQNRASLAFPRLPQSVTQEGVNVKRSSPDILMVIGLYSPKKSYDAIFLSNYATINMIDSIARVKGVGDVKNFTSQDYAMRLWIDPDRLASLGLTPADVIGAVREQNVQAAAGIVGAEPANQGQEFQYNVVASGLLQDPAEFEQIIIRSNADGSQVKVKDVARIEMGAQIYKSSAGVNGSPAAALGIYLAPGANALATADEIKKQLAEMQQSFPPDMAFQITLDSTLPIKASMESIVHTLFEAVVLVIFVVFIFLQSFRATLIPMLTVPVALLGTFMVFPLLGFTVNTLTLFGLVLAIGIVVDDAIVVVEAVMHHLEHGSTPVEATKKAMKEVSGPVVAIALILCAVFVPVAFMPGLTGTLYQQFAITIAASVIFSAINALTLSPALAAMLLRPPKPQRGPLGWFFRLFNKVFDAITARYTGIVGFLVRRSARAMLILVAAVVGIYYVGQKVPGGFIPEEDKGYFFISAELPDAASLQRTQAVGKKIEALLGKIEGIDSFLNVNGFSTLTGVSSPNAITFFVSLKDWKERQTRLTHVRGIIFQLMKEFIKIPEARIFAFGPPSLPGYGNASGFNFMLQDRAGGSVEELAAVSQKFLAAAGQRPELARLFSGFRPSVPQVKVDLDREKCRLLGVNVNDVFSTLQAYLGGAYINDFNRFGRVYRVYLQAEPKFTGKPEDIAKFYVRNKDGKMVPLDTLVKVSQTGGPAFTTRYNLYRSVEISGSPALGYSSAQAVAVMEELAADHLPAGYGYEWTGLTYQEKKAEGQAIFIFGLALIFVFLLLAAQYESWSLPFSVLLATPLVVLGTFLGLLMRGFENNVYAQIGIIMLIGLAAKNAILIVEFAKMEHENGKPFIEAAIEGARLRLRPILMTSFAFILGAVPLAIATGSGANSRQVMGTAVVCGMTIATLIGIFVIPACYGFIMWLSGAGKKPSQPLSA
ncbi:MAG: multidrug efflux RND transporter permease subunit [Verrucomicrobiaceae bacterium]|nr:multidrug efflux RND transporter permease subunit [Verrucomicrobiaceae bacterium]